MKGPRAFWRWLSTPDPAPGFTAGKIGKLFLKAFLFGLVTVLLQLLLLLIPVPAVQSFVQSTWGMILLVILVYLPFARVLSADFAPPPPRARTGSGRGTGSGRANRKRKKYAGVKKSGPRF